MARTRENPAPPDDRGGRPAVAEAGAPAGAGGRAPAPGGDASGSGLRRLGARLEPAAPIAVAALAAVFAFRRLDNYDTWWHLAAGRWIVAHRTVPTTDVLSHTVRDHPWTNLQWAFDVAIYFLHKIGGPTLLVLGAALGFSLAVWLVLRLVRPHLGDAGAALLVLPAVVALQDRFEIRPEMVSFPLFVGLLAILAAGRREGRGLWRLVPLMLVWANTHALFVMGGFALGCAFAGAFAARIPRLPPAIRAGSTWNAASLRRLVAWGLASLAVVVVNPFGVDGALFPAKLFTRINGSSAVFKTIGEIQRPFAPGVGGAVIVVYKILLVAGVAAVLAALIVALRKPAADDGQGRRALDLGELALFSGLAVLSVLARRNIALFVLGGAPVAARSIRAVASALPVRLRAGLQQVAPLAAASAVCAAGVLGALVVSGHYYHGTAQLSEFGGGVLEGWFPVRAAAFARAAKLPPRLFNDVAGGGYLAWDDPIGDGVFIDGRLEVYDTGFFSDYLSAMADQKRWDAEADRFGVQTVILFHHRENRLQLIRRLAASGAWTLVYADEAAAIFVRARGNEAAIARAAALAGPWDKMTREWLERPASGFGFPLGRVEGTRAFARLLSTLGDLDGAAEQYKRVLGLGVSPVEEIEPRLLLAVYHFSAGRAGPAREELRRVLEIDPGNSDAQDLLRRAAAAGLPDR